MHAGGTVPGEFSPNRTFKNLLRFMQGPGSCVLLAMDGDDCCGVLTLKVEQTWYSDTYRCIFEKGFFVRDDARGEGVCQALMEKAREVADDLKLDLFFTIFNVKRQRGSRGKWARVGETIGYTNRGAVIAHLQEN
jgi:hypothetical protein